MSIKKLLKNNYILAGVIILVLALILEIGVFNYSSWSSRRMTPVTLAQNVTTDENGEYYTEIYTADSDVKNINVQMDVENYDLAYVQAILTDEGDKYEYGTPEYTYCNGIEATGFSNIYSFGKVHTIQVRVRVEEGSIAHIRTITANAHKPIDFKPIRFMIVFMVVLFGYFIWTKSFIHEVYFDDRKIWQWCVTIGVMVAMIIIGSRIVKADKLLMDSPWPHHKQYQELAHSIDNGTVELTQQNVDPRLLEVENPYDTITLQAEGIPFSMDYAFYKGHYYEYFGIVPELLFYYPYMKIKDEDMRNYQVMQILYTLLIIGVFATVAGLIKRYAKSFPYFFYILISVATVFMANFVYLAARSDIYNVPILTAITCIFDGFACWLWAMDSERKWFKYVGIVLGSFAMALVAGARPQLLLFSGLALILFFDEGWKKRRLFAKDNFVDTVLFCVPYIIVAIVVCWYNYARFGNIFDFGATYSLTTNDMNHRGFNINRLVRSLYCYLFQPAVINTDFPFLEASKVDGKYMGRFLCEYTYGGILVANTMLVSIWLGIVNGLKKVPGQVRAIAIYLGVVGVVIAAFDANFAGVLYRYTCDFAPAFVLAAIVLWMMYLDRGRNIISYDMASKLAYICVIGALMYSLMTFVASGSSVCLENDNKQLYYSIAQYFRF